MNAVSLNAAKSTYFSDNYNANRVAAAVDVLRRARNRIRARWVQNSFAVDSCGSEVEPESLQAKKWCAIGGVRSCMPTPGVEVSSYSPEVVYLSLAIPPKTRASITSGGGGYPLCGSSEPLEQVFAYNDKTGRTRKQVTALFNRALELAREDLKTLRRREKASADFKASSPAA